MSKILARNMTKGVDFCGAHEYYYVVRSDLNCYLRANNFHSGSDQLEIFSLHPSCRGGDHYLATKEGFFYMIKGDQYRRFRDLTTDHFPIVFPLHPNCRKGDHYMAAFDYFYIIYRDRGVCHRTTNMCEDTDGTDLPLRPYARNGLYYFGVTDFYYFVIPHERWGVEFVESTNFNSDDHSQIFSFHPDIIYFLPGGLSVSRGPAYGEWLCVETMSNDSQAAIDCKKVITKKIGFEKEILARMVRYWLVSDDVSADIGCLITLLTKIHFSLTAEYGGFSVNAEKETWRDATDIEEAFAAHLEPNEKVYIWSYHLGLGKEPVLHCRHMRISDSANPPTDVPLPPAKN